MQIIKDGQIVDDSWHHLSDDDLLPSTGNITVSCTRWLNERDTLKAQRRALGIRLNGQDGIENVAADLANFPLIVVEFPVMADGRGFSLARLLRERYDFGGEIRARGDFIRDQVFFLARVGVNAFESAAAKNLSELLPALKEFSVKYQAATDDPTPLYRKRK